MQIISFVAFDQQGSSYGAFPSLEAYLFAVFFRWLTFLGIYLYNASKSMYYPRNTTVVICLVFFHHVWMGGFENAW